jgi:hypothetical protein
MKLNRSQPFGSVGGAYFGAASYQNGHYFDAADNYLFSNPGVAPPAGATARVQMGVDGPVGNPEVCPDDAPSLRGHQPKEGAAVAPPPPAVVPAGTPDVGPADEEDAGPVLTREQQLMQMHVKELSKMLEMAGGAPITGSGSKRKIVDWLLANTQ